MKVKGNAGNHEDQSQDGGDSGKDHRSQPGGPGHDDRLSQVEALVGVPGTVCLSAVKMNTSSAKSFSPETD